MKVFKKSIPWILIFLLFLVGNIFTKELASDEVWMYGFASNIAKGMIPYKDFNIVVTPLYPMILALPLLLWNNFLVIYIVQSLILTGMYYLLYKILKEKFYVLLILPFLYLEYFTTPQYNILSLFLTILIIYLEAQEEKNDKAIGITLGLSILTKQTIGVFLSIASLFYYRKNINKIKERIIYESIPLLFFLVYLLGTNSFASFFDLCFLGLFDFAGNNHRKSLFTIAVFVGILIHTIIITRQNKKDITPYYVLAYYTVFIPIMDLCHLQFVIFAYLTLVLKYHKKDIIKNVYIVLLAGAITCQTLILSTIKNSSFPTDINHFEYKSFSSTFQNQTKGVQKYLEDHKENNYVFLDYNAYYFKIIQDKKIEYLDLTLTGNTGFHGSDKVIQKIKEQEKENTFYMIDYSKKELNNYQYDEKAIRYVKKHGEIVDRIYNYDIYKIK
ncbi:MAG: hypothetical protein IJ193_08685 [Bacilli bacterium]|nr:hypothetical protein [Bacilli bacterium]